MRVGAKIVSRVASKEGGWMVELLLCMYCICSQLSWNYTQQFSVFWGEIHQA
jgi:hypothetical protein